MSQEPESPSEEKPRRSKLPLIVGCVMALALGGAGFFVARSGLLGGGGGGDHAGADITPAELPDIAFVPIDPVTISLPSGALSGHLRFTAQLEVASPHSDEVAALMPRILDVLNGYLRAVEPASLQEAGALVRVRAQLLRRIQIVTGEGRVRDLLVTEFIFS